MPEIITSKDNVGTPYQTSQRGRFDTHHNRMMLHVLSMHMPEKRPKFEFGEDFIAHHGFLASSIAISAYGKTERFRRNWAEDELTVAKTVGEVAIDKLIRRQRKLLDGTFYKFVSGLIGTVPRRRADHDELVAELETVESPTARVKANPDNPAPRQIFEETFGRAINLPDLHSGTDILRAGTYNAAASLTLQDILALEAAVADSLEVVSVVPASSR